MANDSSRIPPGQFINVGAYKIHYELIGHGKEYLFLLPGGMGSTRTHYGPQLDDLDKNRLTILAWDPPGYGFSGPPYHCAYVDSFHRDAKVAAQLLKALKITKTSVLGWCGGGMTACVLTGLNPQLVDKLVLVSSWGHLDEGIIKRWKLFQNVGTWAPRMRDPLIDLYGINCVQNRWNQRLVSFDKMLEKTVDGEICRKEISAIGCPTLLVHCRDDVWVPIERTQYLIDNISNTKLVEFEDGNHYPHLSHSHRFNRIVEEFICQ